MSAVRRELKVVLQTKDERVAAVPIAVETKVRIAPQWFSTAGASFDPVQAKASFAQTHRRDGAQSADLDRYDQVPD